MKKLYATDEEYDPESLGEHYTNHVSAMTGEALYAKSRIAYELARRDKEIKRLRAALESAKKTLSAVNVELKGTVNKRSK